MKKLIFLLLSSTLILSSNFIVLANENTNISSTINENLEISPYADGIIHIYNDRYQGLAYTEEFNTKASDGDTLNINIVNNSSNIPVRATIYKSGSKDSVKIIQPGGGYTFTYTNDTLIGGVWEKFKIHVTDYNDDGNEIDITVNARQFDR